MTTLKFFLLLALALWLGGIIFFVVGEAPAVLHTVPDATVGGGVINASLTKLHWMGVGCGVAYLLFSLLLSRLAQGEARVFLPSHFLVALMLACTLTSQVWVLPAMARLRGAIDLASQSEFMRLHSWSIGLEAATLLLGLIVLFLSVRRLSE